LPAEANPAGMRAGKCRSPHCARDQCL